MVCRGVDDGFRTLPAQDGTGGNNVDVLKGSPGSGNEAVAQEGSKGWQVQAARRANREEGLDLAGEEQVALRGPVLDVVERVRAGERAAIDERAPIGRPVQHGRLDALARGIGRVGEGQQPGPRLRCPRWLHLLLRLTLLARLPGVPSQYIPHCEQHLFDYFLWHLLSRKPPCKHWHNVILPFIVATTLLILCPLSVDSKYSPCLMGKPSPPAWSFYKTAPPTCHVVKTWPQRVMLSASEASAVNKQRAWQEQMLPLRCTQG